MRNKKDDDLMTVEVGYLTRLTAENSALRKQLRVAVEGLECAIINLGDATADPDQTDVIQEFRRALNDMETALKVVNKLKTPNL